MLQSKYVQLFGPQKLKDRLFLRRSWFFGCLEQLLLHVCTPNNKSTAKYPLGKKWVKLTPDFLIAKVVQPTVNSENKFVFKYDR